VIGVFVDESIFVCKILLNTLTFVFNVNCNDL
jgi:hypothetical protein